MSLSIVHTRAALGVNAPPITVEVHISKGLPGLTMVGLPETTVKEARDRVRSAIINSGYDAYSALFDHGLASKSDQRFASIRSTGNLTFSTA
ncbi:hypothetical protein MP852_18625, partial [Escherichia coli]|uniref:magnesium chelatase domain-containing protein n=1 Tax=Escherichia coli TaxID=562 RepID=UPI0023E0A266